MIKKASHATVPLNADKARPCSPPPPKDWFSGMLYVGIPKAYLDTAGTGLVIFKEQFEPSVHKIQGQVTTL
jgi:hypothetical protein